MTRKIPPAPAVSGKPRETMRPLLDAGFGRAPADDEPTTRAAEVKRPIDAPKAEE